MIKNLIIRYIYPIYDELLRKRMFNLYGVKIEKNVSIDKCCINNIGKYTFVGKNTIIGPSTKSIGSYCSIAPDVIIGPNSHDISEVTTSTFIHAYSSSFDYRFQNTNISYNIYKQSLNKKNTTIGHDVWIGYGAIITIIPLLLTGIIGRYFFKLNYYTLIGVLSGATTNPPALAYSNDQTACDAPAVGYATVYPLTMFMRVLTAQLLILMLG